MLLGEYNGSIYIETKPTDKLNKCYAREVLPWKRVSLGDIALENGAWHIFGQVS